MKEKIRECYWALTTQFGLNPKQTLRGLRALPSFVSDYRKFRRSYSGQMQMMPFLHDRTELAGDGHSEYFLQDLHVAKRIFELKPAHHVDVGSRVDGFVAHVASFRTIEVLDIRPMTNDVVGIDFKQVDLMKVDDSLTEYCDSLSCLHALEHFGLGRYGDRVDPAGWRLGLSSLGRLLKPGGRLFLSAPMGRERVVFNAHRVFAPAQLIDAAQALGLMLDAVSWVADGKLHMSKDLSADVAALGQCEYHLVIFEFHKG